ncbi:MAG: DJ-1/PfpI family protein [Thermoanaerobaculia bacterium]
MKSAVRLAAILLSLVLGAVAAPGPLHAQTGHWVCAPCGLPCDETVYDHPGTCPKCGMPLVDQEAANREKEAAARAQKKVAILIFNGVEIIDYTGPWEIFGAAGFDVYTVAGTKEPVTTAMGMTVLPKYTFADAPQPDVLVVPGGGVKEAQGSAATLKWVTGATAGTTHTMSVCNGAFILASAGLLDGLTATTTSGNIAKLTAEYPKTKVVDDQRFVDNGKIITTAGLSAGIDGALHVVSRMLGPGTAQKVALVEEYDWRPGAAWKRGQRVGGGSPAATESPGPGR